MKKRILHQNNSHTNCFHTFGKKILKGNASYKRGVHLSYTPLTRVF